MKLPWDFKTLGELLKRNQAMLLVLAVGLGLLLWPYDARKQETTQPAQDQTNESGVYLEALEIRIAGALSRIEGVGEATVVLTLESGTRRVLASDRRGEEQETVVVSAGSGQQETVTLQEVAPTLQGALIVCPGAGDPNVRLSILQAVEALTGLRANQISICQGTGGNEG